MQKKWKTFAKLCQAASTSWPIQEAPLEVLQLLLVELHSLHVGVLQGALHALIRWRRSLTTRSATATLPIGSAAATLPIGSATVTPELLLRVFEAMAPTASCLDPPPCSYMVFVCFDTTLYTCIWFWCASTRFYIHVYGFGVPQHVFIYMYMVLVCFDTILYTCIWFLCVHVMSYIHVYSFDSNSAEFDLNTRNTLKMQ